MPSCSLSTVVVVLLAAADVPAMNMTLWLICIYTILAPSLIQFAIYMVPITIRW
jgi:hypothetical protein